MGREEKNTSSASNSASTTTMVGGEVFKLPAPRRRTLGTTATKEEIMMNSGPTIGVDPIRKPIRSLPARSASSSSIMNSGATVGGSSKALFNNTRNEVSLTRRPGHVTKAVKDVVVGVAVPAVRRKRKSVSPKSKVFSVLFSLHTALIPRLHLHFIFVRIDRIFIVDDPRDEYPV